MIDHSLVNTFQNLWLPFALPEPDSKRGIPSQTYPSVIQWTPSKRIGWSCAAIGVEYDLYNSWRRWFDGCMIPGQKK
jgi:hypothetical protein